MVYCWGVRPFKHYRATSFSLNNAINDLVAVIEPQKFLEKFGAPIEQLDQLVCQNGYHSRLMEIVPEGTIDPTPSLYNTTMYRHGWVVGYCFLLRTY